MFGFSVGVVAESVSYLGGRKGAFKLGGSGFLTLATDNLKQDYLGQIYPVITGIYPVSDPCLEKSLKSRSNLLGSGALFPIAYCMR